MAEFSCSIPERFFTPDKTGLNPLAYLFLLLLCVAFFTPGAITMPPTDRDESSFAQASKQMIESGNYVDIRLQQTPRYKKPIGIYWLQTAAVRLFNPGHLDEIWAYRMPSFLGATLAVLMTAALGNLLFNPATGLLAAMMLAGCVLLNVEARLAKTDAALLGCIVTAMYGLASAYAGGRQRAAGLDKICSAPCSLFPVPFFFWTALACGILIKGPIILLPILSALIWLRVSDKNIKWFGNLRPALGLPYALLLIAPWFIAIALQSHGDFLQQSAGQDMLAKLWQGQNRGIIPPGMHLLALPILFFPGALFVVLAAPDAWKNRADPAVKFCLGWIVPTWIVFELSLTKLPHYVLPAYPALALLAAKYLNDGLPCFSAAARRLPPRLIIGFWLAIGLGFAGVFAALPEFLGQDWPLTQSAAGVLLLAAQMIALGVMSRNKPAAVIALTIGSLIFMSVTFGVTVPGLRHVWVSRDIVAAVEAVKPCAETKLVSLGYHEPSLVFLAGTDTVLAHSGAEAANALQIDPCRIAAIDQRQRREFLDAFTDPGKQPRNLGSVSGLNSGHGGQADITLFLAPS